MERKTEERIKQLEAERDALAAKAKEQTTCSGCWQTVAGYDLTWKYCPKCGGAINADKPVP